MRILIISISQSYNESVSDYHSFAIKFQRVKVYRLNSEGKWDDQGTGHVTVDYLEVWLFTRSVLLLECKVCSQLFFVKRIVGNFTCVLLNPYVTMQGSQDLGLFVVDEDDNETLLSHRISSDDIYRKQEGIPFVYANAYCNSLFPFGC